MREATSAGTAEDRGKATEGEGAEDEGGEEEGPPADAATVEGVKAEEGAVEFPVWVLGRSGERTAKSSTRKGSICREERERGGTASRRGGEH